MSANSPSDAPSRRRHRRSSVLVTVRWHNRHEEAVSAEIYDVSAEGLFLVPDRPLSNHVSVGDAVWVVLSTPDQQETLTGSVRWQGFHRSHKVLGCGVHLDRMSLEIVKRVFPDLVSDEPT